MHIVGVILLIVSFGGLSGGIFDCQPRCRMALRTLSSVTLGFKAKSWRRFSITRSPHCQRLPVARRLTPATACTSQLFHHVVLVAIWSGRYALVHAAEQYGIYTQDETGKDAFSSHHKCRSLIKSTPQYEVLSKMIQCCGNSYTSQDLTALRRKTRDLEHATSRPLLVLACVESLAVDLEGTS